MLLYFPIKTFYLCFLIEEIITKVDIEIVKVLIIYI